MLGGGQASSKRAGRDAPVGLPVQVRPGIDSTPSSLERIIGTQRGGLPRAMKVGRLTWASDFLGQNDDLRARLHRAASPQEMAVRPEPALHREAKVNNDAKRGDLSRPSRAAGIGVGGSLAPRSAHHASRSARCWPARGACTFAGEPSAILGAHSGSCEGARPFSREDRRQVGALRAGRCAVEGRCACCWLNSRRDLSAQVLRHPSRLRWQQVGPGPRTSSCQLGRGRRPGWLRRRPEPETC